MDIKAPIFLSFVSIMLFAYGFSPVGIPIVFVLALAFAVAYPIRLGAKMLASRPIKFGGVDFAGYDMFAADQKEDADMQKSPVQAHRAAIAHNSTALKNKHRDNKGIIVTSLLLFAYIMIMTAVVRFIESPGSWASFPAWARLRGPPVIYPRPRAAGHGRREVHPQPAVCARARVHRVA